MKTTDCLGFPYPECDPPLVKDLSDIGQFRDLAIAVDTAVQELANDIVEELRSPDYVAMSGTISNVAGNDQTMVYAVIEANNAGMADTSAGGFFIKEDGEYLLGGWVDADAGLSATSMGLRIEPFVNGELVAGRHGPGFPTFGTGTSLEYVSWMETVFLRVGDFVNARTHQTLAASATVTYTSRIWALLVMPSD